MSEATAPQHTAMGRLLDVIERAGNKVPHPVMMFLYLIIGVIVLSAVLAAFGVSVTEEIAVPDSVEVIPDYYEDATQPILEPGDLDYEDGWHVETVTIPIVSLLSTEGIRFIFTSFVPNFAGFGVVAVTFVALMGAGVAEAGGLMAALIRVLVGGVTEAAADLHPRLRRGHVERGVGRRVPDPRAPWRRGVHERRPTPAWPAWPPVSRASARPSG